MAIWSRLRKSTPEDEKKFKENMKDVGLEKNDMKALLISAFIVIMPVCLGIVLFFAAIAMLFFTR